MRVLMVQPTVPKYRLAFFEALNQSDDLELEIIASKDVSVSGAEYSKFEWFKEVDTRGVLLGFLYQPVVFQRKRYDVVVIFGNPRYLSNIFLLFKCKALGISVVWWTQLESFSSSAVGAWLRLWLARFANSILFYTDEEIRKFKSFGGAAPRLFALNNAIDTASIQQLSMEYDSEQRGKNLLFIGRLIDKTDLGVLITAISLLEDRDIRLHVIGDGDLRDDFVNKTKVHGVCDQVIWHGALRDETLIAPIANECCMMVYPGAIGLAVLHAMSYGLPCVIHSDSSKHGPEASYLEVAESGETFLRGDSVDLARIISRVLSSTTLRQQYSNNARRAVTELYNNEVMTKRMLIALRATLGGSANAGAN